MCSSCGFACPYEYFGPEPPFSPQIKFYESAYFMRDPFSAETRALCVGGHCRLCGQMVSCSPFRSDVDSQNAPPPTKPCCTLCDDQQ